MKSVTSLKCVVCLLSCIWLCGITTTHARYVPHDEDEMQQLLNSFTDERKDDQQLASMAILQSLQQAVTDNPPPQEQLAFKRTVDARTNIATLEKLIPLYIMMKNKSG
ncbi:uncharacterized protein LOC144355617 [Saccoglossus kowalevskii]